MLERLLTGALLALLLLISSYSCLSFLYNSFINFSSYFYSSNDLLSDFLPRITVMKITTPKDSKTKGILNLE